MAILIPRKKEFWQKAPVNPEVDWNKDLAKGLSCLFIQEDPHPRNIVDSEDATIYGVYRLSAETHGDRLMADFASAAQRIELPAIECSSSEATIFTTINPWILNTDHNISFKLLAQNTYLSIYQGKVFAKWRTANHFGLTTHSAGESKQIAATLSGGISTLYSGGIFDSTNSDSATLSASSAVRLGKFGTIWNSSLDFRGAMGVTGFYSRALSDEEIAEVDHNPYQILKPRRKYWALPVAGVQAPSVVRLLNLRKSLRSLLTR